MDASNQEPLAFASIYLKGTSIGTTSNLEGSFQFHVPFKDKDDFIVVSLIGYKSVEKRGVDFAKDEVIQLEKDVLTLGEVVVTSEEPLSAKEIVKKAYSAIDKNYPADPYLLEGFVRDLQMENSAYVELLECAIKLKYQGNAIKRRPKIELVALRQNPISNKHPWNKQFDRKNSIVDLVEDDFIRYGYGPIIEGKGWKYEIESVLPFGDKFVYKIIAENKPFSKAQLFIDVESLAFVRIEYNRAALKKRNYKRRLSNGQQEVSYNLVLEYQEFQGKWYLKYQKEEDAWKIFKGLETRKLLFTKYPKKELFINKVIVDSVDRYPFVGDLDPNSSMESQAKPYNPEFWKYYNAPTQTKTLSKIEEYLKKSKINQK